MCMPTSWKPWTVKVIEKSRFSLKYSEEVKKKEVGGRGGGGVN